MAANLTMNGVNRICCIGATTTGVLSTLVASEYWPAKNFIVVDQPTRIQKWQPPGLRHYEPGLQTMITNRMNANVQFRGINHITQEINAAQIIIIAADNKIKNYGLGKRKMLDLSDWDRDMRKVLVVANTSKIIIMKSQLEPDFAKTALENVINSCRARNPIANQHHVFWVPEFFSAGTAFHDLRHPSRVLITPCCPVLAPNTDVIEEFYVQPGWVLINQIIITNVSAAIMGTIGVNIVLALRGIVMNMMAELCEEIPGNNNIDEIQEIMRTDPRINIIGNQPLRVSAGVGGPALIRDLEFLSYLAEIHEKKSMVAFFKGVIRSNIEHQRSLVLKISRSVNCLKRKSVGILGFSYKENTGYVINSAAIEICRKLLSEKARQIRIYDREVQPNDIMACFHPRYLEGNDPRIMVVNNLDDLWLHSEVLCFLQHKPQFDNLNWPHVYAQTQIQGNITEPSGEVHLFDTCNVLRAQVGNIRQLNNVNNNGIMRFRINILGHPQLV